MIKNLFFVLALLLCCLPRISEAVLSVEIRSAAFFPLSSKYQKVYGDVHPCYEIEINKTLCNCYKAWVNVDALHASKKRSCCEKTNLDVLNFSLGLKLIRSFCKCLEGYVGVGIGAAWARIHNHHYSKEYSTSAVVVAKLGCNYFLKESVFIDLFVDYNYQPAFRNRVDIGGFKTGIGIGYAF